MFWFYWDLSLFYCLLLLFLRDQAIMLAVKVRTSCNIQLSSLTLHLPNFSL